MNAEKKLTLGQRLRRERENLNLSQDQLAAELGTSALSINRWENDKTVPRPYYRKELCRVFNLSTEALFNLQDEEEGEEEFSAEQNRGDGLFSSGSPMDGDNALPC